MAVLIPGSRPLLLAPEPPAKVRVFERCAAAAAQRDPRSPCRRAPRAGPSRGGGCGRRTAPTPLCTGPRTNPAPWPELQESWSQSLAGEVAKQGSLHTVCGASQLRLLGSTGGGTPGAHGSVEAHRNLPRPLLLPLGSRRRRGISPLVCVARTAHDSRNSSDNCGCILSGYEPGLAQGETS